jgi:hypothetical protein
MDPGKLIIHASSFRDNLISPVGFIDISKSGYLRQNRYKHPVMPHQTNTLFKGEE